VGENALKLADEVLAKEYAPRLEIAKELRRLHLENEQLKSREWVGLTVEEIKSLPSWWPSYEDAPALIQLVKDVEAKLREKNA
jgi:hypothetical protein